MGGSIKVAGVGLAAFLLALTAGDLGAGAGVGVGVGVAAADTAEDRAAIEYQAGEAAYRRGDFRAAATSFEAANRLDPHGATSYNAALAWDSATDRARAADDYAAALQAPDLSPAYEKQARARLAALEPTLGVVVLLAREGARVSLAHVRAAAPPVRVHLLAGSYDARCTMPDGSTATRALAVAEGTSLTVDFSNSASSPPPSTSRAPHDSPPPLPPAHDTEASPGPLRTLAWVALGGAAVLGVTSAALYFGAQGDRDQFVDEGKHSTTLHDEAETLLTGCWIVGALAGVTVGASVVLFVASSPSSKESAARAQLTVGPGSLGVAGTF